MYSSSFELSNWFLNVNKDRMVSTTLPATLLTVCQDLGSDPSTVLTTAGLDLEQVTSSTSDEIPFPIYLRLWMAVNSLHSCANLGLIYGQKLNIAALGALGLALLSCTTLKEAFELGIEYRNILGIEIELRLSVEGDNATLFIDNPFETLLPENCIKSETYSIMSCLLTNCRYLIGEDIHYTQVALNMDVSSHMVSLSRFFNCEIISQSKENKVVFSRKLLNRPIQYASPYSYDLLRQTCQQQSNKFHQPYSTSQQVALMVLPRLQNPPPVTEVADELSISARSLSRQLTQEGLNYQSLLDELRKTRAKLLLQKEHYNLTEVAHSLGFSDLANFRRAFKRWVRVTPSHYRSHYPQHFSSCR